MKYDEFCQELTDDNLRYAVDICSHTPKYKVFIAVTNRNRLYNVIRFVADYITTPSKSIISGDFCEISFSNNSIIYIYAATNKPIKGIRVNYSLVENEIDEKIVNAIIKPMQVDYVYRSENW